jgi:TPR repeat protein
MCASNTGCPKEPAAAEALLMHLKDVSDRGLLVNDPLINTEESFRTAFGIPVRFFLASLFRALGRFQIMGEPPNHIAGVQFLKESLELDPLNGEATMLLCDCYSRGQGVEGNGPEQALQLLQALVVEREGEPDNLSALLRLAHRYERGDGVTKDSKRAVELLRRILTSDGSEEGFGALAQTYLAEYQLTGGGGIPRKPKQALQTLHKLALKGHTLAFLKAVDCYQDGVPPNIPKSPAKAMALLELFATNGDCSALIRMSERAASQGDHATAFRMIQDAADGGSTYAQTKLADLYLHGCGVEKNEAKAVKMWTSLAAKGDQRAVGHLVKCYARGLGVPRDADKILELLTEHKKQQPMSSGALSAMDTFSKVQIALCLQEQFTEHGSASHQDMAVDLLTEAGISGDSYALSRLADCYSNGNMVGKCVLRAALLLTSACLVGDEYAMFSLMRLLETSEGTPCISRNAYLIHLMAGTFGSSSTIAIEDPASPLSQVVASVCRNEPENARPSFLAATLSGGADQTRTTQLLAEVQTAALERHQYCFEAPRPSRPRSLNGSLESKVLQPERKLAFPVLLQLAHGEPNALERLVTAVTLAAEVPSQNAAVFRVFDNLKQILRFTSALPDCLPDFLRRPALSHLADELSKYLLFPTPLRSIVADYLRAPFEVGQKVLLLSFPDASSHSASADPGENKATGSSGLDILKEADVESDDDRWETPPGCTMDSKRGVVAEVLQVHNDILLKVMGGNALILYTSPLIDSLLTSLYVF